MKHRAGDVGDMGREVAERPIRIEQAGTFAPHLAIAQQFHAVFLLLAARGRLQTLRRGDGSIAEAWRTVPIDLAPTSADGMQQSAGEFSDFPILPTTQRQDAIFLFARDLSRTKAQIDQPPSML